MKCRHCDTIPICFKLQEYSGSQPNPAYQQTRNQSLNGLLRPRSPEGERYNFSQRPDSCLDDVSSHSSEVWKLEQIPKEILRDMRRPSHFQKLDQSSQPQRAFKDLSAKMMSQVSY